MQLYKTKSPARTDYEGDQTFDIASGQFLKIETTPEGFELLNEEVPVGKKWIVTIRMSIREEDE